jgi:hypothetical protein
MLESIEYMMRVAQDTKKDFSFDKAQGKWFWFDRDERNNADAYHGPFDRFASALADAVEPYLTAAE